MVSVSLVQMKRTYSSQIAVDGVPSVVSRHLEMR
jgi:hypothetical protein